MVRRSRRSRRRSWWCHAAVALLLARVSLDPSVVRADDGGPVAPPPAVAPAPAAEGPVTSDSALDEPAAEDVGIVRAAPAKLRVLAVDGAVVSVDGTIVGETPFPFPIELEPGRHRIEVAANGFERASREVDLPAGRATDVPVDLAPTAQRQLAWGVIGTGFASIAAGIAFGVASVIEHRRSRDIGGFSGDDVSEDEQEEFDAAIEARDDFRLASGLGAGVGLGLVLVGGILFTFDEPEAASPARGGRDRGPLARPTPGPGLVGGGVALSF